jgi:hypothetical protein
MHIMYMLPRVSQSIIIFQTHFYENIVYWESSVQYLFGQERTPPLMVVIVILLGMLMYKLFLNSLFVRLLGA